jgi:hypothetical protein
MVIHALRVAALNLFWLSAASVLATSCWADAPPGDSGAQVPAAGPIPVAEPAPETKGFARWFNPATAPFIPVPEIAVSPNSGTTLGLIPTWIQTDENHDIRRIVAPDVIYNPYFGVGAHGRIYEYSSGDEQWSAVAGIKERVEREFDGEYQSGRLREQLWSTNYSVIYDVSGTPRFYGIGNKSLESNETNYTDQQELVQVQVGLNLTHAWQLLYTGRFQNVDVLPGTLSDIPSIATIFPHVMGLGTNRELLNRLSIVYDTRDDLTVPSTGTKWVAYGGLASKTGSLSDSLYSEAGLDGRAFWPLAPGTVLTAHMAIRYMPTTHDVPFWALSNIGGGESEIGGEQPLRGFGEGRFCDRDSFSTSIELRQKVMSFNAISTNLDIEVAPFIDLGRVFAHGNESPVDQLHPVGGVGFRGIARPFVVGYVDIGYGSEGVAVFTGLNYPF